MFWNFSTHLYQHNFQIYFMLIPNQWELKERKENATGPVQPLTGKKNTPNYVNLELSNQTDVCCPSNETLIFPWEPLTYNVKQKEERGSWKEAQVLTSAGLRP